MAIKHHIECWGGVEIVAHEFGNPAAPAILLIHGYAQSYLSWQKQIDSDLADEFRLICVDNRGHGESGKPLAPENYNQPAPWADDIHNVIGALALERPVLVGWSYGGYIIGDYLAEYGESEIAGINFVAAGAARSAETAHLNKGSQVGPLLPLMFSDDMGEFIEGTRKFLRICFAKQPSETEFETALAYNALVPAKVRAAMFDRIIDHGATFSKLTLPALVTHGREDLAVRPPIAEYILSQVPHAEASWYDDVGHSPFAEDAERFNRELAAFVRRCQVQSP